MCSTSTLGGREGGIEGEKREYRDLPLNLGVSRRLVIYGLYQVKSRLVLFIAVLLTYVFFLVFWALSPALAIIFAFLVVIVLIAWLSEKVRG
jgi:hypothetical protein